MISTAIHAADAHIKHMAPKPKSEKQDNHGVWQDRDIRFDSPLAQLAIHAGEFQIDSINSVEDTKGNNGEKGSLAITNLRLVWICHRNSRLNLSIGYNAVLSINIRTANSRLRGNTQALYVMTKYNNSRFEFVFTGTSAQLGAMTSFLATCVLTISQSLPTPARDFHGHWGLLRQRARRDRRGWRREHGMQCKRQA